MTWVDYIELIATVIIAGLLFAVFLSWIRQRANVPSHVKANLRTEKRLLQSILDDIKKNRSNWMAVPYDPMSQREPHLINDKKNMAVLVSSDQVVIKFNLKAAHKYKESAEETIATTLKGKHVKTFIRKAEGLIDTRGRELSFIEDMLSRRL